VHGHGKMLPEGTLHYPDLMFNYLATTVGIEPR
jgi:hypothetical protein